MTVHLVGAGPGSPDLVTVRGAALLRRADVVVHDRLVDPALLGLVPPTAELVDVGKRAGVPHRQEDINALLVDRGRSGATVVRLKGGDPYVFGRGGEEVGALRAAGVAVEVVPGVTAAFAAPAAAGVPVTARGVSTSVTVVTGHVDGAATGVDWAALAATGGTLVVLMGMAHRAAIADALIAGGRAAGTPVLVVHWGTTARQRTARTTLGGLAAIAMEAPATIVVGPVAALRLGSLEDLPLHGLSVVVTRPRHQAGALADALAAAGAAVTRLPVVALAPAADGGAALRAAARATGRYRWVAVTSANAADALAAAIRDARDLGGTRLAAVGAATADALARARLIADLVPDEPSAEGLVAAMPPADAAGAAVLHPRSSAAAGTLARGLRAKGWVVDEVEAYRTVCPDPAALAAGDLDAARAADAVVLASPSAVANWVALVGPPGPERPAVICIGPVTAAAAAAAGLPADAVAQHPHPAGVVAALAAWRHR